MCDLGGGGVLVARPRGGPGDELANIALERGSSDFESYVEDSLDHFLERFEVEREPYRDGDDPVEWRGGAPQRTIPRPKALPPSQLVELWRVPEGQEIAFVTSLQEAYIATLLSHADLVSQVGADPDSQLRVSPNWRLRTSSDDGFNGPFRLAPNVDSYVSSLGIGVANCCGAGVKVAVLDTGFDPSTWVQAPVGDQFDRQLDLIPGDSGSSAHGTLVAALVSLAAPRARIRPIRIAGSESTDWDAIRALYLSRRAEADVIVLAFRQVLAESPCANCGLVRSAARSEVFARALENVTEDGMCAVVVAGGNSGLAELSRPASYPGALAVAALDIQSNQLEDYSNWDGQHGARVWAVPGSDVAEEVAGGPLSGTSFACAFAGGLLAAQISHAGVAAARAADNLTAAAEPTDKNAVAPRLV
jgi:Subtilase family